MTLVRPLFLLLLISCFASSAYAAGDGSNPQAANGSVQNQTADPALFEQAAENQPGAPDLFFLKARPQLDLSASPGRPRSAVLNDADCYTMRMYKVKRKERFASGENGLRGYSTCELASNYQVRTAVAHAREADDRNDNRPQK